MQLTEAQETAARTGRIRLLKVDGTGRTLTHAIAGGKQLVHIGLVLQTQAVLLRIGGKEVLPEANAELEFNGSVEKTPLRSWNDMYALGIRLVEQGREITLPDDPEHSSSDECWHYEPEEPEAITGKVN